MDLPAKDTDPMAYFEQRFDAGFHLFPIFNYSKNIFYRNFCRFADYKNKPCFTQNFVTTYGNCS